MAATPSAAAWWDVVDALDEAVVAADAHNEVIYVNRAAETLLGWSTADLIGQPLTTIVPPRFRARHLAAFARFMETGAGDIIGRPLRVPALRKDGTETPIEMVVSAAHVHDGPIVVGLLRDVTERIELEGPGDLADRLVSALAEAATLDDALLRVLQSLGEALSWDVGQLWLNDDDGPVLRRRCTWSGPHVDAAPLEQASDSTFRLGEGLPGRVWEALAPAWVRDVRVDLGFTWAAAAAESGLCSGFAFPIVAGSRFVGVIELFSAEPRDRSDDITVRLSALGREIGWFIERRTAEEQRMALLEAERLARADAEQHQERLSFLARASEILAESLDLRVTLAQVASLAVPTLGDWCLIHLFDGEAITVAAAAHAEPALVDVLREAHDRYPTDLAARDGVGAVVRTGETTYHPAVTDDVLRGIARDEGHLDLLRLLGFGAVVCIPLTGRGRRLGAVTIASDRVGGLSPADTATAEDLARRAAVAIDNAQLHNELRLQAALLRTQSEAGLEGELIVSPTGEMLSFNRRFAEMWGFPDSVMDRRFDDEALAHGAEQVVDPEAFLRGVRDLYAHPRASRDEIQFVDGRVFDRVGAPLHADDVYLGYAWYFRDITDQKRAARELFEAGERFATLARTLQQSLLPPQLPSVAGVELAARYHPAGAGVDVGGDFYDVFRLGRDSWGVMVGDVCGKGPDAAAITAFARYTIRAAAMQTRSPARALAVVNDAMLRHAADGGPDRFATAVHARLRPRRGAVEVVVACGGHPLPLVRRAGGAVETIGRPGTLLGVLPSVTITDAAVTLHPGDAMVLVTDGVVEARLDGDQFGDDRLHALLATTDGQRASEIAATVEQAVLDHQHGVAIDDLAVLVLAPAVDAASR